ncbi:MAG: putative permease, superfamily [Gaiellaceae bacterium]|nr:putative permease, superfamily [Gaiellaceae bacterium]
MTRRPALGYAMVLTAATLWALNGAVSKVILQSGGVTSERLTEVRATGAFLLLFAVLLVWRRSTLRVTLGELPFLAVFGVAGLAFVAWFYFVAIERLEIGIALLIQYVAPVLVALYARYVLHEPVRRRIWAALALAIAGLALLLQLWQGLVLDGIGVLASLGAAVTFALYILMADRGIRRRTSSSLLAYGFLFAALFWAVVQPWMSFPWDLLDDSVSLLGRLESIELPVWLLMAWMVVLGTIVPFGLLVGALRHVSPTRAGILAMFEPVAGTVIAYAWLREELDPIQLVGAAVVLCGIGLAQTAR